MTKYHIFFPLPSSSKPFTQCFTFYFIQKTPLGVPLMAVWPPRISRRVWLVCSSQTISLSDLCPLSLPLSPIITPIPCRRMHTTVQDRKQITILCMPSILRSSQCGSALRPISAQQRVLGAWYVCHAALQRSGRGDRAIKIVLFCVILRRSSSV